MIKRYLELSHVIHGRVFDGATGKLLDPVISQAVPGQRLIAAHSLDSGSDFLCFFLDIFHGCEP